MTASTVHTDASALSRADRLFFRVESAVNLGAGVIVLALMLLAVVQIVGRKLFNAPVPGFIDWVEQFMAVFAFLGLAYCQRVGGHIRMDIVIGRFRGRSLWFAECLSTVLMLLVTSALIYGSWLHFLRALQIGDSSIDIALPVWPAKLMVPLALSLLWVRLSLQLWGYVRALRDNPALPIGVPLIEDAATQARHEAEALDLVPGDASPTGTGERGGTASREERR